MNLFDRRLTPALRRAILPIAVAAIFVMLGQFGGRMEANQGRGYDGIQYVNMLSGGVLDEGEYNQRLRPLIVLLNRPVYWMLGDGADADAAIRAFDLMNIVYIVWFSAAVLGLASAYGAGGDVQIFLALNLALCISTARYFAYYPTLIDLGAYAVMTTAVYFVVTGRRVAAGIWTTLAVLSREFAPAIALLGIHRDLRTGHGPVRALATYGPALALAAAWRSVVAFVLPPDGPPLNDLDVLRANVALWFDPQYVAFFVYFSVTVFGGITLLLAARAGACLRMIKREPEWITFAAGFIVVGVLGGPDIWRYLAFLAPLAVVLLVECVRDAAPTPRRRLMLLATAGTMLTQRPFEPITIETYFVRWFPYYVISGSAPHGDVSDIWPFWGWMMLGAIVLLGLLIGLGQRGIRPAQT